MATPDDFYEVLEVGRDASREEIQRAYHRLARRYHPDVNTDPTAEQRFRALAAAYEALSDPLRRARYDRARFPRRVPVGTAWGRGTSGHLDIGDLLDGAFGGGRAGAADLTAEIEISVEDAYTGGRGEVTVHTAAGARHCTVTVPAGAVDGQRIRVAGDLTLVVRLAPHPRYRVAGRDVTVELPVTPWEAVLGTRARVDTPAGSAEVEVPAGSSTGRRLRLAGRGMPNPRGTPGDLFAELKIVVPTQPTAAERALFEQLARRSTFNPRQ